MVARPDVDPGGLAVIGVSQAGYWVPRALAFEHRFAAAVADPGVVDVSTSWTRSLPGFMRAQLEDPSKKDSFDKEMGWTERLSKSTRATTRLLITEPEAEQFWPGHSRELYDLLPGSRELARFTAAEGANRHCEPMGLVVRDARVFDWLGRYLEA